jgi:hypothetical protein
VKKLKVGVIGGSSPFITWFKFSEEHIIILPLKFDNYFIRIPWVDSCSSTFGGDEVPYAFFSSTGLSIAALLYIHFRTSIITIIRAAMTQPKIISK